MAYMVEGGGSKTYSRAKAWLYTHPQLCDHLLRRLTDATSLYLVGQAEAGAQVLQVFESNAEYLSPELFDRFALPALESICDTVKRTLSEKGLPPVPMIVFPKGGHYALRSLSKTNYDVIGVDWTVDPALARQLVGPHKTLQGNLDPCALYGDKQSIEERVRRMVTAFGNRRYIANLGHGMYPDMEPEKVAVFVDAVHRFSGGAE
ncbi:Uroporphyrinogen decarboxylase (URO-D) [Trinorchestia longiramus]|nr:Uroporphyrinogen decarboxylase (URO-D) [Trinorchestia longiramus]